MSNYPMPTPFHSCFDCQKKINEIGITQPCALCYLQNPNIGYTLCNSKNCKNEKEEHSSNCSQCLIKIKEIEGLIESTKLQIKSVIEHLKDKYGIEKICIFETN